MRAALISFFFLFPSSYPEQPTHCRCCKCATECLLCCLPLKGLFWSGVGGVQVVHLVALAQNLRSYRCPSSPVGVAGRKCQLVYGMSSPLFLFLSAFSCARSENRARLLVQSRTSDVGAALTRFRTHRRQHRSTSQDSALPSSCILNNIFSFMNLLAHHLLCSDTHDSAPLESSVQAEQ